MALENHSGLEALLALYFRGRNMRICCESRGKTHRGLGSHSGMSSVPSFALAHLSVIFLVRTLFEFMTPCT